jgi:hypothetical protein
VDPFTFIAMTVVSAAVSYGISYLFPAQGPRLKDLTVSASTYGAAIPQIFGSARSAGNLIWADKIVEHKKKKKVGKGGGSYIDYTYTCTFAFAFCKGPVTSVTKLWADGKVLFDRTSLAGAQKTATQKLRIYLGDESQVPDPAIEAIDGVGNVPAYRGLCYIVFEDQVLGNYGNRIPQMAAQVSVSATPFAVFTPVTATDVFEDNNGFGNVQDYSYINPLPYEGQTLPREPWLPQATFSLLFWGINAGSHNVNNSDFPHLDLARGYWYKLACHFLPDEFAAHTTNANLNSTYGGFTRINLATLAQDFNVHNYQLKGNLYSWRDYTDYGWEVVPSTSATPLFREYRNFISNLCGVGPDGSVYIQEFFASMDGYAPYLNSTSTYRLDPITYKPAAHTGLKVIDPMDPTVITETWGWRPFTDPDGVYYLGAQRGDMIFSNSGASLCRVGGLVSSLSSGYTGGVFKGGHISVLNARDLTPEKLMIYRAEGPALDYETSYLNTLGAICPFKDNDFCFGVNDGPPAAYVGFPADVSYSRIDFFSSEDNAAEPFYSDIGGDFKTRLLNWVVWDSASPGIIYQYTDVVGIKPGEWLVKYSTETNSVVWRTWMGESAQVFLSGNSKITSNRIAMAARVGAPGVIVYVIDTLTGRFLSPNVDDDGVPRLLSGTFNGVNDDLSTELGAAYYQSSDNAPSGYRVSYPAGGQVSITQLYDGAREIIYCDDFNGAESVRLSYDKSYMGAISIAGVGQTTLGHIVENLLRQGGLTGKDFDVSALLGVPVYGYGFANNSDIKGVLAELRQVYLFDLFESDFILKARVRGDSTHSIATIDQRALASSGEGLRDDWKQTRLQDADLPAEITMGYMDVDRDFQAGTANFRRPTAPVPVMFSRQQASLSINAVMTATEAANRVRKMGYSQWTERTKHDTRLPWTYAYLDPSDLIEVNTLDDRSYFERIESMELGADLSLATETFSQDSAVYLVNSRIVGDGGAINAPQPTSGTPASAPFIINTPLLRDSDDTGGTTSRFYGAVGNFGGTGASRFTGATLYQSYDDESFEALFTASLDIEWGRVVGLVPAPAWGCESIDWQTQITISPAGPGFELTSITDSELWSGANALLIGEEIIQYRDAVENPNGTWTISYLLRGRRGTEWAAGIHEVGDTILELEPAAAEPLSESLASNGLDRWFKAISTGLSINSQPSTQITYVARDLMPYSPVDVRRDKIGSDFVLHWSRRTRLGGGLVDATGEVPLHETAEAYELYILATPYAADASRGAAPASYLRKADLTDPTFTYTAAMQATDGFDPAVDTLNLVIFQLSGIVGRGFPGVAAIGPYDGLYVVVSASSSMAAGASAFTLTLQSATLAKASRLTAAAASFAETGQTVGLAKGRRLTADAVSFVEAAQAVTLRRALTVAAGAASYALTGQTVTLATSGSPALAADAYAGLMGAEAVILRRAGVVLAGAASYTLAAQDVTPHRALTLSAGAASFVETGQAITYRRGYNLTANAAAFVDTGKTVGLSQAGFTRFVDETGSVFLDEAGGAFLDENAPPSAFITVGTASFAASAQAATLVRSSPHLAVGTRAFILSGKAAGIYTGSYDPTTTYQIEDDVAAIYLEDDTTLLQLESGDRTILELEDGAAALMLEDGDTPMEITTTSTGYTTHGLEDGVSSVTLEDGSTPMETES